MVNTVFSRDSCRILRCASASAAFVTSRVGPVASVRRMSASTVEGPTAEMKSLRMPTSGSPRSWKPQLVNSIVKSSVRYDFWRSDSVTQKSYLTLLFALDNNVHQPAGHHDHFLRLLAGGELHHRLVRRRRLGDLLAARGGRDVEVAA